MAQGGLIATGINTEGFIRSRTVEPIRLRRTSLRRAA